MTEETCESRRFCLWPLVSLLILGFLSLCMWASFHPSTPTYWITDLSIPIPGASFNHRCCEHGAYLSYTLEIHNPNKKSTIDYKDIGLTFIYERSESLSLTDVINSFWQKKQSARTTRSVEMTSQVWKAFLDGISKLNSTSHLDLTVRLSTMFQFKTWGINSKHHREDIEGDIPIGSDGKITGEKHEIQLHHP